MKSAVVCILLVSGFLASAKNLGYRGIQVLYVCEGDTVTLSCVGGKKISILEADYGRRVRNVCPVDPMPSVNCSSPASVFSVRNICDNQTICKVTPTDTFLGDPCVGNTKYLEVKYKCV